MRPCAPSLAMNACMMCCSHIKRSWMMLALLFSTGQHVRIYHNERMHDALIVTLKIP